VVVHLRYVIRSSFHFVIVLTSLLSVLFIFLILRPYVVPIQNVSEFFAIISHFGTLIYYDQSQVNKPTYINVDALFLLLNTAVILGLWLTIYFVEDMDAWWTRHVLPLYHHDKHEKLRDEDGKEVDHRDVTLKVKADGPPVPPSGMQLFCLEKRDISLLDLNI
jgi:hypothetical protein